MNRIIFSPAGKAIFALCFFSFALTLAGCSDKDKSRIETFTISPQLVPNGTNPPTSSVVYCMEATSNDAKEKYYLAPNGGIEGFTYEEGYVYVVRVLITPIENLPMDIIYPETFKLIEVLSKTKVD